MVTFIRVALDVVLLCSRLRALLVVAEPFIGDHFARRMIMIIIVMQKNDHDNHCNDPRRCASCSTCNRMLDASSAVAGQGNCLYCQVFF